MTTSSQTSDLYKVNEVADPFSPGIHHQNVKGPSLALPDGVLAHLLSYLPLKDQIRVQSVNRQWHRCALRTVRCLNLNLKTEDNKAILKVRDQRMNCHLVARKYNKVIAFLAKFQRSEIGLFYISFRDNRALESISLIEPLMGALSETAKRAETVQVFFILDYSPSLETFYSLCDVLGPWITHLCVQNEDLLDPEKNYLHTLETFSQMKKLRALGCDDAHLVLSDICPLLYGFCDSMDIEKLIRIDGPPLDQSHDRKTPFFKRIKQLALNLKKNYQSHSFRDPLLQISEFDKLGLLALQWDSREGYTLRDISVLLWIVSKGCPQLTSLCLGQLVYESVTVTEMESLFRAIGQMKMLRVLKLCLKSHVKGDLQRLAPLSHLRHLTIKEFSGHLEIWSCGSQWKQKERFSVLTMLNKWLPNIEQLHLVGCLVEDLAHLVSLLRLQRLDVCGLMASESSPLTNKELIDIVTSCPLLTSLKVSRAFDAEALDESHFFLTHSLFESLIEVSKIRMNQHLDLDVTLYGSEKEKKLWAVYRGRAPRNFIFTIGNFWQFGIGIGACGCSLHFVDF